jgi:hypothetical protein
MCTDLDVATWREFSVQCRTAVCKCNCCTLLCSTQRQIEKRHRQMIGLSRLLQRLYYIYKCTPRLYYIYKCSQGVCPLGITVTNGWMRFNHFTMFCNTPPWSIQNHLIICKSSFNVSSPQKPCGKIRSTQYLLDNENDLIWIPKEKYACNHHA